MRVQARQIQQMRKTNVCKQGKVVIPREARFTGKIVADFLGVAGEVHGDVEVTRLIIYSTGRLYGKAAYRNVKVYPGGVFSERTDDVLAPDIQPSRETTDSGQEEMPAADTVSRTARTQGEIGTEVSAEVTGRRQPRFYMSF